MIFAAMETTKKIRLIIEAEVCQDSEISPAVLARTNYQPSAEDLNDPEWQEGLQANQALLAALLANPQVYREVVLRCLEANLTSMPAFMQLAGFPNAGFDALEQLVPEVPEPARQFWRDCQQYGTFSDQAHLAFSTTTTKVLSMRLEDSE